MCVYSSQELESKSDTEIEALINARGVNGQDEKGRTMLMYSLSSISTLPVANKLLSAGANVNLADKKGQTALDICEKLMLKRISIARYSSKWVPTISETLSKLMLKMLSLDVSARSYPAMQMVLMGQENPKTVARLIESHRYHEALEKWRS